jgi:FixJ family two-component response regulator
LIAVVDDDAAVCEAISSLVRSAGYRCASFGSAEALLRSGRLPDIDCILPDVRMPGMSGLDLQQALNRRKNRAPIIFVTAAQERAVGELALAQGAAAFLTKTFDHHDLLGVIGIALNHNVAGGCRLLNVPK